MRRFGNLTVRRVTILGRSGKLVRGGEPVIDRDGETSGAVGNRAADRVVTLEERLKLLTQPQLLLIDEIGYLPIDRQGANLFFQLASRRYERRSIIITSKQSLGGWGEVRRHRNRQRDDRSSAPPSR